MAIISDDYFKDPQRPKLDLRYRVDPESDDAGGQPDAPLPELDKRLIRLDENKRNEIAQQLKSDIDAGIETQGRMPNWWLEVERVYRNEVPATQNSLDQGVNDPGYPMWQMPFSQPRLDMLTAQVCTVVGKQEPYMTDTTDDEELAESRQDLGHRVWADAKFPHQIVKAATICGNKDLAIYRICPGPQRGTIQIDVIDPGDFMVFPALPQGIQASAIAGHRTNKRRRVIRAMQKRKEYYPTEDLPESTQADHDDDQEQLHTGTELSVASPSRGNELVELWDCIARLDLNDDGDEQLYRVTLDYVGCQLLALEEYKKSYIWYFRSFFIGSAKYFYSGMSVGRNLYPIQTAYNSLWSCFYGGAMSSAKPPVFGPPPESGEKFTKYGYGQYVEVQAGTAPFSPSISFNGQPFPTMLGLLERAGDAVARISQNTQGAQTTGQTTATEQSIIAAGVATGLEQYIANFSSEFPMMMAHTMELIYDDYEAFAERFGTLPEPVAPPPPDLSPILDQSVLMNGGQPPIPPVPSLSPFPNQFEGQQPSMEGLDPQG